MSHNPEQQTPEFAEEARKYFSPDNGQNKTPESEEETGVDVCGVVTAVLVVEEPCGEAAGRRGPWLAPRGFRLSWLWLGSGAGLGE